MQFKKRQLGRFQVALTGKGASTHLLLIGTVIYEIIVKCTIAFFFIIFSFILICNPFPLTSTRSGNESTDGALGIDPFNILYIDKRLEVAYIPPKYSLLLNKYNTLDEHVS